MTAFPVTARNRVRRLPARSAYDKAAIYPIIDEALICHVGFVDEGQPFVIPTIHGRQEDTLFLHGAKASRLLKVVQSGQPVCITFTLLDGLVMARSVFHSSMNYRSTVVFGVGRVLEDPAQKLHALAVITEHVARGRWQEARQPTEQELNATAIAALTIESASAKVRSGPPVDDEEDYALPIWGGVLPLRQQVMEPAADGRVKEGVAVPASLRHYHR